MSCGDHLRPSYLDISATKPFVSFHESRYRSLFYKILSGFYELRGSRLSDSHILKT